MTTAGSMPGFRGTLMVQGTTSDAGKSTLVAGLCRVLARRGVRVAPFKPQNMALNSAVTADGGEIGRAQALQALAAGVRPHTDMNPVLLKPSSDTGAQIIIHGRARFDMDARAYHSYKPRAMSAVLESYRRLQAQYDCILVEGAGSPAEVNLRERDIANMGFAEKVDCPVVLVADIDRGGVFAQVVGTLECLSSSERGRIRGFIINRFRGDVELLRPGLAWLEQKTGKPVFGVLPYLYGLHLDAEDAIQPEQGEKTAGARLRVIAPVFPRISNHTDFDALRAHPQVEFSFIGPGRRVPRADLIVLPGSKSVQADLDWLIREGWEPEIKRHLRYGGKLIGVCGGMQMLGTWLHDPRGFEGTPGSRPGLGLLDYQTTLEPEKQLREVRGRLALTDALVSGYEIHMGITVGPALEHPAIVLDDGRLDGALSEDGQVLATYLHGLFDEPEACAALLAWAGLQQPQAVAFAKLREASIERLADTLTEHLRIDRLLASISQAGIGGGRHSSLI